MNENLENLLSIYKPVIPLQRAAGEIGGRLPKHRRPGAPDQPSRCSIDALYNHPRHRKQG